MMRGDDPRTGPAGGGFFTWLKHLFAGGHGTARAGDDGKPGVPPKSVQRASSRGGNRGKAARKSPAQDGSRKPPARKIAHHAGAGLADAAKADTRDRAKQASRARKASKNTR